ncbi:hypothetical protein BH09GEM1_BH09GEM1_15110 [soil metagenome]
MGNAEQFALIRAIRKIRDQLPFGSFAITQFDFRQDYRYLLDRE